MWTYQIRNKYLGKRRKSVLLAGWWVGWFMCVCLCVRRYNKNILTVSNKKIRFSRLPNIAFASKQMLFFSSSFSYLFCCFFIIHRCRLAGGVFAFQSPNSPKKKQQLEKEKMLPKCDLCDTIPRPRGHRRQSSSFTFCCCCCHSLATFCISFVRSFGRLLCSSL